MMRIGIDCRTILSAETGELAGTAHYTYELVRHILALQQEAPLHARVPLVFVLFFDGRVNTEEYRRPNVEIVTLRSARMPFLTTHLFLSRALTRAKLDLFHSPAHPLPFFYRGKMIYTVHDLAIYDHPEWFPGGMRRWFSMCVTVPRSISRAEKLIAPSESTKRDIVRIFNVPEEKVRVVHEGVPGENQKLKISAKGGSASGGKNQNDNVKFKNYFLFVGTIEPRKNLVRLIEAFIRFRQTAEVGPPSFRLILAGSNGWKNNDVFMAIERANVKLGKGSVQYLGYVSEEEKIALLHNATAFVWPSLYEGFGLPVLEAMAMGVPVITSRVSSIPEITDDAAVLVNPESVDEIVAAMKKIVSDDTLREQLKTRGFIRAKQFSWERTARRTLEVYREVFTLQFLAVR